MFSRRACLVCQEKDKRIEDLHTQIALLRQLAIPQISSANPSAKDREMDRLFSGSDDAITLDHFEEIEASNILTGSYENSQVEVN